MNYDPPVSWEEQQYLDVKRENDTLREQNRVLRCALDDIRKKSYEPDPERPALSTRAEIQLMAESALTATSQPAQEQCSYCKRPLTDNHSFSYGVPGVPRVYKCDRADCTKPATSQEVQHGSRT